VKDVVWPLQCTCIVPKVHNVNLVRGGLHGHFLHLRENFRSLSQELGQGFAEVLREGPSTELGKVPIRCPREGLRWIEPRLKS
jgi:hypothetical protein